MSKVRCSRCGKVIDKTVIRLENTIQVYKISETGVMVPYNNLSEPTSEILCPECFDKYCQAIDRLNEEYSGMYLADMVEVMDDIQYGDSN